MIDIKYGSLSNVPSKLSPKKRPVRDRETFPIPSSPFHIGIISEGEEYPLILVVHAPTGRILEPKFSSPRAASSYHVCHARLVCQSQQKLAKLAPRFEAPLIFHARTEKKENVDGGRCKTIFLFD